ncbi:MAG TPA: phosphoglucomutase/phosphomannomutase family protein [Flavobacteriales bacterium]|nr:phosphoglucomutase/phosphomannomutase family protein [Flavobacteriales bacterium]HPH83586.1 phosphoglucomutase/phosphomannomutase family protein [Flavobacteriales bacterium]
MTKIKFGTDGWRAIIADEFTVENVARVSEATAIWLKKNSSSPSVVIGHDCRFAGELFAETTAKVMICHGVKVFLAKGFVSTPMVSMGAITYKTNLGIVLTASHNPPSYNGFKLKGSYGGPLLPDKIDEIETIIPETANSAWQKVSLTEAEQAGTCVIVDLEGDYCQRVESSFDLDAIRNSNLEFAYDAMFGAGQNVIRRLLPNTTLLHCDYNPSFEGQAPEPIAKNLTEFSEMIRLSGNIDCGLATDGDADRIGLFDSEGKFVDSHHIILLLIHYLKKYKGLDGKVCTAFSSTVKVKTICDHYGLDLDVVKIGFKYIAGIMITDDVLLGGEESGGIAIKGHIPERDGIWMGLVIWEFMAKSGKTLDQLIEEVYEITGAFSVDRNDLHLPEAEKQRVITSCKNGEVKNIGDRPVIRVEDMDGFKYFVSEDEWLMVRPSGTEPLLRVYAEAHDHAGVMKLIGDARKQFGI